MKTADQILKEVIEFAESYANSLEGETRKRVISKRQLGNWYTKFLEEGLEADTLAEALCAHVDTVLLTYKDTCEIVFDDGEYFINQRGRKLDFLVLVDFLKTLSMEEATPFDIEYDYLTSGLFYDGSFTFYYDKNFLVLDFETQKFLIFNYALLYLFGLYHSSKPTDILDELKETSGVVGLFYSHVGLSSIKPNYSKPVRSTFWRLYASDISIKLFTPPEGLSAYFLSGLASKRLTPNPAVPTEIVEYRESEEKLFMKFTYRVYNFYPSLLHCGFHLTWERSRRVYFDKSSDGTLDKTLSKYKKVRDRRNVMKILDLLDC